MKSDPKRGSRRLVLASAMLTAAIAVPVIGGASAAPLASTPFHVKAQNADESARFAIKPLLEAKKIPAPEPTAPGTIPPVTTTPPFSPTTIFYHNGGTTATGNGVVESKKGSGDWQAAGFAVNVTGQPSAVDKSNQTTFAITTIKLSDRSIRLTIPEIEPGSYSFSLFGLANNVSTWEASTQGAESQSIAPARNAWGKVSLNFTTESKGPREILIKVTMPSPAQYGDTIYWDDVTLKRIG